MKIHHYHLKLVKVVILHLLVAQSVSNVLLVRINVPHSVRSLDATLVLECFHVGHYVYGDCIGHYTIVQRVIHNIATIVLRQELSV